MRIDHWLTGNVLDAEVALCEGVPIGKKYSTDWVEAGKIISRVGIGIYVSGVWDGRIQSWTGEIRKPIELRVKRDRKELRKFGRDDVWRVCGYTALEAAMRVYVISINGEEQYTNETDKT